MMLIAQNPNNERHEENNTHDDLFGTRRENDTHSYTHIDLSGPWIARRMFGNRKAVQVHTITCTAHNISLCTALGFLLLMLHFYPCHDSLHLGRFFDLGAEQDHLVIRSNLFEIDNARDTHDACFIHVILPFEGGKLVRKALDIHLHVGSVLLVNDTNREQWRFIFPRWRVDVKRALRRRTLNDHFENLAGRRRLIVLQRDRAAGRSNYKLACLIIFFRKNESSGA